MVTQDEREKLNDDLAGVQAERDLLERKVNELTLTLILALTLTLTLTLTLPLPLTRSTSCGASYTLRTRRSNTWRRSSSYPSRSRLGVRGRDRSRD